MTFERLQYAKIRKTKTQNPICSEVLPRELR